MKLDIESFLGKPQIAKKEKEIILRSNIVLEEGYLDKEVPEDEEEKKFAEFIAVVTKAIDATSGLKKIIEQTQDKEVVKATPQAKQAMKRLLNLESDVITFEIYQQAIALREELVMSKMRKAMLDEQFK